MVFAVLFKCIVSCGSATFTNNLNLLCLFDRMTQEVFMSAKDIALVSTALKRKPLIHIDISKDAKDSLIKANQDLGLALSEEEISYLDHFYSSVARNPTDAELMMFAQANSEHLNDGLLHQVLLGVTGSGKTYTMAKIIESTQRPAVVMAPNKTLAAQLYGELKDFFPKNSVEYFVSYYDYYQPEAYVPTSRAYFQINEDQI